MKKLGIFLLQGNGDMIMGEYLGPSNNEELPPGPVLARPVITKFLGVVHPEPPSRINPKPGPIKGFMYPTPSAILVDKFVVSSFVGYSIVFEDHPLWAEYQQMLESAPKPPETPEGERETEPKPTTLINNP